MAERTKSSQQLNYFLFGFLFSYYFINFFHNYIGFHKRNNNFLIVFYIRICQFPAFAVFEPFLGWLVTANVKIPSNFWYSTKIFVFVYINFIIFINNLFHLISAFLYRICSYWHIKFF